MTRLNLLSFLRESLESAAVAFVCKTAVLLGCLTLLLSGCARLPVTGTEAARLHSTVVARLDAEPLFAANAGGKRVAISSQGVSVVSLPSGESRTFFKERPLALAWSPDGVRLASAFRRGNESRITVFGADGDPVAETAVTGRVLSIFWTAPDVLLAVTMELEHHRFGTSCREVLLRWKPAGAIERTVLHDITLKPYTVRKWGEELLAQVISPAISPLGDEMVYGRIHDPPALDAYLKVVIRNISNGVEREISQTALTRGTARFSADGEELFLPDASGQVSRIDVWSGAERPALAVSGRSLAVSPDGRHLLADGRLLEDDREVVKFTSRTTGEFIDDGRLLVVDDGILFLVSGFGASVVLPSMVPEKLERLRTIRAWRAAGLISAVEYLSAKGKVMK